MTRILTHGVRGLTCALACVLLLACNDDDDGGADDGADNVIGPDTGGVTLDDQVLEQMNAAVEQAIGLLFVGGGTVPGAGGGQIVVEGSTFRFEDYSPDGVFILAGALAMDLLASPITVKGDLTFENEEGEGPIVVDMTIDASTDPITYGGTVTVDGEVIDVAALE